jgi:hypothetical protein
MLHSCSCGCCPRRPLKHSSQHAYVSKQFATRVYFPLRTSTRQASCNGCCIRTSKRLSSAMASLDRSCPNPALATARVVCLFFLPDDRWNLFLPVLQVCLEAGASNLDVSAPFRPRVGRCQHAGDGIVGSSEPQATARSHALAAHSQDTTVHRHRFTPATAGRRRQQGFSWGPPTSGSKPV